MNGERHPNDKVVFRPSESLRRNMESPPRQAKPKGRNFSQQTEAPPKKKAAQQQTTRVILKDKSAQTIDPKKLAKPNSKMTQTEMDETYTAFSENDILLLKTLKQNRDYERMIFRLLHPETGKSSVPNPNVFVEEFFSSLNGETANWEGWYSALRALTAGLGDLKACVLDGPETVLRREASTAKSTILAIDYMIKNGADSSGNPLDTASLREAIITKCDFYRSETLTTATFEPGDNMDDSLILPDNTVLDPSPAPSPTSNPQPLENSENLLDLSLVPTFVSTPKKK